MTEWQEMQEKLGEVNALAETAYDALFVKDADDDTGVIEIGDHKRSILIAKLDKLAWLASRASQSLRSKG